MKKVYTLIAQLMYTLSSCRSRCNFFLKYKEVWEERAVTPTCPRQHEERQTLTRVLTRIRRLKPSWHKAWPLDHLLYWLGVMCCKLVTVLYHCYVNIKEHVNLNSETNHFCGLEGFIDQGRNPSALKAIIHTQSTC